jgi:transcriptional regulator with XRE-family HTH domain
MSWQMRGPSIGLYHLIRTVIVVAGKSRKKDTKSTLDPREAQTGKAIPKANLGKLRETMRYDTGRLAARIGVGESTAEQYITGRSHMPNDVVVAAAADLGVSVPYLLDLTDDPDPDAKPAQGYAVRRTMVADYLDKVTRQQQVLDRYEAGDNCLLESPLLGGHDEYGFCYISCLVRSSDAESFAHFRSDTILERLHLGRYDFIPTMETADGCALQPGEWVIPCVIIQDLAPDESGHKRMVRLEPERGSDDCVRILAHMRKYLSYFYNMPGDYRDLNAVTQSALAYVLDKPNQEQTDAALASVTNLLMKKHGVR